MARFAALLVLVALAACSYDLDAFRPDGGGGGMDARTDGPPPPPVDGPIADVPIDRGMCMVDVECDDLDACNGIETCEMGVCIAGTVTGCSGPDPCMVGVCNPIDGSCAFEPGPDGTPCGGPTEYCCRGTCTDTIASATACGPSCIACGSNQRCESSTCTCDPGFGDCDSIPDTGCEADFDIDEDHCGMCGVECTGTMSCIGGVCMACTTAAMCNDSLTCTTDTCSGGTCSNSVTSGCLIAGTCYTNGQANPMNACEECRRSTSSSSWSPRTGTCGPPGAPTYTLCGSFSDVCDTTGTQVETIVTPTCMGTSCLPMSAMRDVSCSRMTDTVPCSDGMFCTAGDVCNGGVCIPGTGAMCGVEGCDEAMDRCFNCGARYEPCCGSRGCDNTSSEVCCGGGVGTCLQCCVHADCDPTGNNCPGGGMRWECIGGGCCFGPCDGSC